MRPVRLELEGFMAFRDRTIVDFAGVDLFALTGPTGAGKSTVIDAIIFALYGTVPRFDDARLVGAVVSQGRPEGRVRLDFDVGGQRWTAVRVVRVRDGKATTKEARLERGGEVVAGNAKELDAEVTTLLGLDAHQFMTCVVLPQGQFARFLQAKPADRQDLLVRLLELGLYDALRDAAGLRAGRLEGELAALRLRLAALGAATPETVAAEEERLGELGAVLAAVEALLPEVAAADRQRDDLCRSLGEVQALARLLDGVRIPSGVQDLTERAAAVHALVTEADAAELVAVARLAEAVTARESAGERAPLEAWSVAHEERPEVEQRRQKAQAILDNARARRAEAAAALDAAVQVRQTAEAEYESVVADNRAAALRSRLAPGQPCPVCDQLVVSIPHHDDPAEVGAARQARELSARRETDAADAAQAAEVASARAQERAERAEADATRLQARLAGAPSPEELAAQLAAVAEAEQRLGTARALREQAAASRRKAGEAVTAAAGAAREAWQAFERTRDRVGPLGPPTADRESLGGAWTALADWSAERRTSLADEDAALKQAVATTEVERRRAVGALDVLVRGAGLEPDGRPHRDVVVEARAQTEQSLSALRQGVAERQRLTGVEARLEREAQVAAALKLELHANRFEKWVLDHVLRDLCTSATELLHRLSQQAYSLGLDDRAGFVVVDHRNADETRLARTLSGGETFLASLALALALAEQVAQSGHGAPHLESLFLDEGFGTLDLATLDVVAGAIEDLGSAGRMVGLISHVPELAERVPVRFEVRRGPRSSSIERVDR